VSEGADYRRDCTYDFGREWETGADGVCERGGISGEEGQGYSCGESGVDGWLDVDMD